MCGIAGLWSELGGRGNDLANTLDAMNGALAHRGPDGRGHWIDADAGLALTHTRLAIIDLTSTGSQPMVSHDGDLSISFNGEIYNCRELRRALRRKAWRGTSDTEILLEAVADWGVAETLKRIDGMFAFALWSKSQRRLWLARDAFGEKPIYWGKIGNTLAFASELPALRAVHGFSAALDPAALGDYLRYGYIRAPRSIYAAIAKVPAGAVLEFAHPTTTPKITHHWDAVQAAHASWHDRLAIDDDQAATVVEEMLTGAVERRMVSDAPLGCLLSGGIDSTVAATLMQRASSAPIQTFSLGAGRGDYDETCHARATAAALGTEHRELHVTARDCVELAPRLAGLYGEPFADSSQFATYLICAFASQHVKVAISGDGGDELFGGYNRYVHPVWPRIKGVHVGMRAFAGEALSSCPEPVLDSALAALGPLLSPHLRGRGAQKLHKIADLLGARDETDFHERMLRVLPHAERYADLSNAPSRIVETDAGKGADFAERAMLVDSISYLPDDILVKTDRASMAHGLELRTPYLNKDLFRLACQLPINRKISNGRGKLPLRGLLAKRLPGLDFDRAKQGFAVPIGAWLRDDLKTWARALIEPQRLREQGILNANAVETLWRRHQSGSIDAGPALWLLVSLQSWIEEANNQALSPAGPHVFA